MRLRPLSAMVLAVVVLSSATAAAAVSSPPPPTPREEAAQPPTRWEWPVAPPRIVRPYVAPPSPFAAGHRGIDLESDRGAAVRAPSDGVVAFSAAVAGRGVVTIDHGGGYVSTLEPVDAIVRPGTVVRAGDVVAHASRGGHSAGGALHFGVRLHGEYVNPLLMWGGVPHAVLLPCC